MPSHSSRSTRHGHSSSSRHGHSSSSRHGQGSSSGSGSSGSHGSTRTHQSGYVARSGTQTPTLRDFQPPSTQAAQGALTADALALVSQNQQTALAPSSTLVALNEMCDQATYDIRQTYHNIHGKEERIAELHGYITWYQRELGQNPNVDPRDIARHIEECRTEEAHILGEIERLRDSISQGNQQVDQALQSMGLTQRGNQSTSQRYNYPTEVVDDDLKEDPAQTSAEGWRFA